MSDSTSENKCSACGKKIKTRFRFKDPEGKDQEIEFKYAIPGLPFKFCSPLCSNTAKNAVSRVRPEEFFLMMQNPSK